MNNPNWTKPSTIQQTNIHHNYQTAPAHPHHYPPNIDPHTITKAWWTQLLPGGYIKPHTDKGPYQTRWHYPTQPAGYTWHNNQLLTAPHQPFQIQHWTPHAIWNPTPTPRIHLIIETNQPAPAPNHQQPLQTYPWPPHLPQTPQ